MQIKMTQKKWINSLNIYIQLKLMALLIGIVRIEQLILLGINFIKTFYSGCDGA